MDIKYVFLIMALKLLGTQFVYADVAWNNFKLIDVTREAPKVWHRYITKFMQRFLERDINYYRYSKIVSTMNNYSQ